MYSRTSYYHTAATHYVQFSVRWCTTDSRGIDWKFIDINLRGWFQVDSVRAVDERADIKLTATRGR